MYRTEICIRVAALGALYLTCSGGGGNVSRVLLNGWLGSYFSELRSREYIVALSAFSLSLDLNQEDGAMFSIIDHYCYFGREIQMSNSILPELCFKQGGAAPPCRYLLLVFAEFHQSSRNILSLGFGIPESLNRRSIEL